MSRQCAPTLRAWLTGAMCIGRSSGGCMAAAWRHWPRQSVSSASRSRQHCAVSDSNARLKYAGSCRAKGNRCHGSRRLSGHYANRNDDIPRVLPESSAGIAAGCLPRLHHSSQLLMSARLGLRRLATYTTLSPPLPTTCLRRPNPRHLGQSSVFGRQQQAQIRAFSMTGTTSKDKNDAVLQLVQKLIPPLSPKLHKGQAGEHSFVSSVVAIQRPNAVELAGHTGPLIADSQAASVCSEAAATTVVRPSSPPLARCVLVPTSGTLSASQRPAT